MNQEVPGAGPSLVSLEYAPPRRGRRWLRPVAYAGGVALVMVTVVAVVLSGLNQPRDHPPRLRCASNLRQIGQAVQMYANENNGLFPPNFEVLLLTQDITSDVFVCHASQDERAEGPTTRAVAARLSAGGHLSYVYAGRGMSMNSPPGVVVAYERPANHRDGINVLFADGHVEWINAARGQTLFAELAAGHNPPRAGESGE